MTVTQIEWDQGQWSRQHTGDVLDALASHGACPWKAHHMHHGASMCPFCILHGGHVQKVVASVSAPGRGQTSALARTHHTTTQAPLEWVLEYTLSWLAPGECVQRTSRALEGFNYACPD